MHTTFLGCTEESSKHDKEGEVVREKAASRWPLPALSSLLWFFSHYLILVLLSAASVEKIEISS